MKSKILTIICLIWTIAGCSSRPVHSETTIVAPESEVAEDLDLKAVSVLFKNSKNIESFERALNDPSLGINNLDLNRDGEIDFIRVVEESKGASRLVILQVPLAKDEYQDVATIEVERYADNEYRMHLHGHPVVYGPDFYITPMGVHIHAWPVIGWMYGPVYRPYRSGFYFGFYPSWWRPWRPAAVSVYHTRVVNYVGPTRFHVKRVSVVRPAARISYTPRSSTLVKRTRVTRTTKVGGKTTRVTKGAKVTKNNNTGKKSLTAGSKKVTKTKKGSKTKVKKVKIKKQ